MYLNMSVISKMYMYTWDFIKHKYLKCLLLLRIRKENPKSCFWYISINHLLPSLLWVRILYYITLNNIQLDLMGYREAIPHCVGCYNSTTQTQ